MHEKNFPLPHIYVVILMFSFDFKSTSKIMVNILQISDQHDYELILPTKFPASLLSISA